MIAASSTSSVHSVRNQLLLQRYKWEGVVLGGEFEPVTEVDFRLMIGASIVAEIRKVAL